MRNRIEEMGRKLEGIGFERFVGLVEENEGDTGEEMLEVGVIYRHKTNVRAEVKVDSTTIGMLEGNFANLAKVFSA